MKPPGAIDELGADGLRAWNAIMTRALADAPSSIVTAEEAPDVRTVDWPAFPLQTGRALGTRGALELLDARAPGGGDVGRITAQDEYVEWRLIRNGDSVRGVEMTTELREYWRVLAGHEPARTLRLVAEFAGEDAVAPEAVYGRGFDPFGDGVGPEDRSAAFGATMLPPANQREISPRAVLQAVGPYNDGTRAICCMIHASNTLGALVGLIKHSARSHLVRDSVTGEPRFASGDEAIGDLEIEAATGRNSDPLLVERVVRYVTEGRTVGIDDPFGVYIRELQLHELEQPDGSDVPADWLVLSRGLKAEQAADERPRTQRLRLEVPGDADFDLSGLVVRRTGESVRFGGQLAALVELAAYLRTGPVGD